MKPLSYALKGSQAYKNNPKGVNHLLWHADRPPREYPQLMGDVRLGKYDVVVIGGGITGMTCALQLKRGGRKVAVLERHGLASGTTGCTTGHLTNVVDSRYASIEKAFGLEASRLVYEGLTEAIEHIEYNSKSLYIDCNFERLPGYLYADESQDSKEVSTEYEALVRAGMSGAQALCGPIGLPFAVGSAIMAPNNAQFHSVKYIYGLAGAVEGDGCDIFEHSRVVDYKEETDSCTVATEHGSIRAQHVVMATHSPLGVQAVQTQVAPYRSYVMVACLEDEIPHALFWDSGNPYHYIRRFSRETPDLVIIGGADHKQGATAHEEDSFLSLERYIRQRFRVKELLHSWSSQWYDPVDGLPYIGLLPMHKRIYTGTGFLGDGLTFGTLAAVIMADEIMGKQSRFSQLFSLSRIKPLSSARKFVAENISVAKHWVADRFHSDAAKLSEVPAGEGRVLTIGATKVAAFRDEAGALNTCSAVCPHLKCIVKWNNAEKTWDCPCHGARFDCMGKCLEGPALADLEELPVGLSASSTPA